MVCPFYVQKNTGILFLNMNAEITIFNEFLRAKLI